MTAAPVVSALQRPNVTQVLVRTGQHHDKNLSDARRLPGPAWSTSSSRGASLPRCGNFHSEFDVNDCFPSL